MKGNAALLSMREAAAYLALDYKTFSAYVQAGMVDVVRFPSLSKRKKGQPRRTKLFRKESLDRFIAENEITEGGKAGPNAGPKSMGPTTRIYPKGWHIQVGSTVGKIR